LTRFVLACRQNGSLPRPNRFVTVVLQSQSGDPDSPW
jgi:hypothetical protein